MRPHVVAAAGGDVGAGVAGEARGQARYHEMGDMIGSDEEDHSCLGLSSCVNCSLSYSIFAGWGIGCHESVLYIFDN